MTSSFYRHKYRLHSNKLVISIFNNTKTATNARRFLPDSLTEYTQWLYIGYLQTITKNLQTAFWSSKRISHIIKIN